VVARREVLAVELPDGTLEIGAGDGSGLKNIGALPLPVAWSPDGQHFLFLRDGQVWIARVDGGDVLNFSRFPLGGASSASWSPDGRFIEVRQGVSSEWLIAADGTSRRRVEIDSDYGLNATWSPRGDRLAVSVAGERDQTVLLFAVDDLSAVAVTNAWNPIWSPDGRFLAVLASDPNDQNIDVMNADGSGRFEVPGTVMEGIGAWIP
jgi:Tol biopolymer transport system component